MTIACQVMGRWVVDGEQESSRVYVKSAGLAVWLWLPGQGMMELSAADARVVGAALVEVANSCDKDSGDAA